MWTCPTCERNFKSDNQSHICVQVDIDELFIGKPDDLLLAFDKLLINVIEFPQCSVGATHKAIIFTKEKAWMVVRPMSKLLDLTFFFDRKIDHLLVFKVTQYNKVFRHQVRIANDHQVTEELLTLLKKSFTES